MPGYVQKALQRFAHPDPERPQHSPSPWKTVTYGAKIQYADLPDDSTPLTPPEVTRLQEVIGTLLFYTRAVDSTMLVALGTLAASQTKGTEATADALTHFLNYCATHPDATIRFHKSDMILHLDSDASYLSEPRARSIMAGYHYLSTHPDRLKAYKTPPLNGAVLVPTTIMKVVVSSAAEAELGALFHNGQDAIALRTTLEEIGWPQPPTPITTDNLTAACIANDTVKQGSKAVDMGFYWIRDRVHQKQFTVKWKRGLDNHADYFTKHHPPSHHRTIRARYIHSNTHRRPIPANEWTESHCEGVLTLHPGFPLSTKR
jgi:hypothetical protein